MFIKKLLALVLALSIFSPPVVEVPMASILEDFQTNGEGGWKTDGNLSDYLAYQNDPKTEGNVFLQLFGKELRGEKEAVKTFAVPNQMDNAQFSFDFFAGSLISTYKEGSAGISLKSSGKEIFRLFIGELRTDSDRTRFFYSLDGHENIQLTDQVVAPLTWHRISINIDFTKASIEIKLNEVQIASTSLKNQALNLNQLAIFSRGLNDVKVTPTIGIDNLAFSWSEGSENGKNIGSLLSLDTVTLSKEEWEAGYNHPTMVEAMLVDGTTHNVKIDSSTWVCTPPFNPEEENLYTWTAAIREEGHPNPRELKAHYEMNYVIEQKEHDYWNNFNSGIWENIPQGREIDKGSYSGNLELSQQKDMQGATYMKAATANAGGHRGSRLALENEIIRGAEVSFDWMPILSNATGSGEIMFFSPAHWNSYFTLRFDSSYRLYLYTKCSLTENDYNQVPFEGSISKEKAQITGLQGNNRWYRVALIFDYISSAVDVRIYAKDEPEKVFSVSKLPIDPTANGLSTMLLRMAKEGSSRASMEMGIDNLAIDYRYFTENDIVSIDLPANVTVARDTFKDFIFPETATVTIGGNNKKEVALSKWRSEPSFNPEKEGEYIWTADIVSELENPFGLKAMFVMEYVLYPYAVAAYDLPTLELEYGEPLPDEFSREVIVQLSDGSFDTMQVEKWKPIREFNSEKEGIYIWEGKLQPTEGVYTIKDDIVVQHRINYFKTGSMYNVHERSMEYLDRGVYGVQTENGVFVSWRLLSSEYGQDISFNVYRNGILVNQTPIRTKTNFIDVSGRAGDKYTVEVIQAGTRTRSKTFTALEENYISIPMQKPIPQPNRDGQMSEYTLNDAGVADVDGDGSYEIVVKWVPLNAFDSGKPGGPSSPTIFDVYRIDGTPLWRLNLGLEMPSGAHFNQFMFYDLDEDGKAEFLIKTSDGSKTYRPNKDGLFDMEDNDTVISVIGDKSIKPGSNIQDNGHVLPNSNEYITVFRGLDGEAIDTIPFVNETISYERWGDNYGNRASRYNIAIGYIAKNSEGNETIPAVLFNRGYYALSTVTAYTLRNNKLHVDWNWISQEEEHGKGNHNVASGDIDNDGFDELILGSVAIDHDGTTLWVKNGKEGMDNTNHGDAIHLAAMSPEKEQLYLFTPHENKSDDVNYSLSNAATGARILGHWVKAQDTGRGVAANITDRPGFEIWASRPNGGTPGKVPQGAIYNFFGDTVALEKPANFTANWVAYWDGDLLSELPDGLNPSKPEGEQAIFKYNSTENAFETIEVFTGTKTNNWTKNNPCLAADILGDWREEIVARSGDDQELRIYLTTFETEYMIYSLMHDPVYRNAVAGQNSSYNQPPHLGFYLGEDIKDKVLKFELPVYNLRYTSDGPNQIEMPEPESSGISEPSGTDPVESTSVSESTTDLTSGEEFKNNLVICYSPDDRIPVTPPEGYVRVTFNPGKKAYLDYNPTFSVGQEVVFDVKAGISWGNAKGHGLSIPNVNLTNQDMKFMGWSPVSPDDDVIIEENIKFEALYSEDLTQTGERSFYLALSMESIILGTVLILLKKRKIK